MKNKMKQSSQDKSISRRNFIAKSAVGAGALGLGVMDATADNANNQNIDVNTSPREVSWLTIKSVLLLYKAEICSADNE